MSELKHAHIYMLFLKSYLVKGKQRCFVQALLHVRVYPLSCVRYLVKDARSSLYPYNRSAILKNVKYTKQINTAKGIANFCYR